MHHRGISDGSQTIKIVWKLFWIIRTVVINSKTLFSVIYLQKILTFPSRKSLLNFQKLPLSCKDVILYKNFGQNVCGFSAYFVWFCFENEFFREKQYLKVMEYIKIMISYIYTSYTRVWKAQNPDAWNEDLQTLNKYAWLLH